MLLLSRESGTFELNSFFSEKQENPSGKLPSCYCKTEVAV